MKTCNFVPRPQYEGQYEEACYPPNWPTGGAGLKLEHTNCGLCACVKFHVDDHYHWHYKGICHNRTKCKPLNAPWWKAILGRIFS